VNKIIIIILLKIKNKPQTFMFVVCFLELGDTPRLTKWQKSTYGRFLPISDRVLSSRILTKKYAKAYFLAWVWPKIYHHLGVNFWSNPWTHRSESLQGLCPWTPLSEPLAQGSTSKSPPLGLFDDPPRADTFDPSIESAKLHSNFEI
jgi:hypothetical protein